jgi:membrane protease YdiL (CAAX protease family)
MSAQAQWIFALTSIAVGIKEEIAFRALIQNLLVPRIGRAHAIFVTMSLFILFHVGVVPPLRQVYIHIALAGLFFGLVFEFTQRLWLVIALHALFDAVLALLCTLPFHRERSALGFLLLLGALVSAAFWRWRVMRPKPNGSQSFRQSARVE